MPGLTLNFPIKPGPPASTEEDVRMVKNYLFRLTEQLQYLFNNLGVENLTQEAVGQLAAAGAEAGRALLEGRLSGFQTAGQTEAAIAAAVAGLEGRVEALEEGGYSTTPVRLGRYLDTPYSVYKVVVPFPGTSTSATFTAPAAIRRIVSAVGSGYGGGIGYWVPIPFASPTALGWQASFRCAASGDACTLELVKGSNVTFADDSVEAVVEFVC